MILSANLLFLFLVSILDKDTLEVTEVIENNLIVNGNDVVIDLNGQLITADDVNRPTLEVEEGGSLTIVDRSQEQDGKVENKENIAISIKNGGELTLGENGDIVQDIPSVQAPIIEGGTFGVNKEVDGEEEGIFNFYDGKVIGGTTSFAGSTKIDDKPLLYDPSIVTEDGKQVEKKGDISYLCNKFNLENPIICVFVLSFLNSSFKTSTASV